MKNYFDEPVAARYDDADGSSLDPALIDFLASFGDPALEFGIGTGRVALPLAARGVSVHGIDLSEAMVARLRAKAGGDAIPVEIGDFATTRVDGTFALVYLVFNTIMNLTTQEAQVACFENAARHLQPGGVFVIEVGVPDLRRLPPGERLVAFSKNGIDEYDVATQGLISHHHRDGGTRSIPFRYVWPSELDLMARIAGLRLRERWEDWTRTPFGDESRAHVSVWERPQG